jgi:hypothetical protein
MISFVADAQRDSLLSTVKDESLVAVGDTFLVLGRGEVGVALLSARPMTEEVVLSLQAARLEKKTGSLRIETSIAFV